MKIFIVWALLSMGFTAAAAALSFLENAPLLCDEQGHCNF
jgi:hypothetical protein